MNSEAPGPDPDAFGGDRPRAADRGQRHERPSRGRIDDRADPLRRLVGRPAVYQWADDEIVTLEEARALFFPNGPLTVKSLRSAVRLGQLASDSIAGRLYTTPSAVRSLLEPQLRRDAKDTCGSAESMDDRRSPRSDREAEVPSVARRRGRKPKLLHRSW